MFIFLPNVFECVFYTLLTQLVKIFLSKYYFTIFIYTFDLLINLLFFIHILKRKRLCPIKLSHIIMYGKFIFL